jgi:hypothetical protein
MAVDPELIRYNYSGNPTESFQLYRSRTRNGISIIPIHRDDDAPDTPENLSRTIWTNRLLISIILEESNTPEEALTALATLARMTT